MKNSASSQNDTTTEPMPDRKPALALVTRLLWAAALVLPAFGAQAAAVLTTLHSFNGTNGGANPSAGLVQGSDGYFYGTTYGSYGGPFGTVFKISANGMLTTLHAFGTVTNEEGDLLDGVNPEAGLVQGSDSYFYGTTYYGGTNGFGYGTVFKISSNGVLKTLYDFGSVTNAEGDPLDGGFPQAALVQGTDGNFYGTTYQGGPDGNGTVFRLTIVPKFHAVTISNSMLSLTSGTERGGT